MDYPSVLDTAEDYVVAVTIATEVGPDSTKEERMAVASVIWNRARHSHISPLRVVMAPKQFSGVLKEYWGRYLSGESMELLTQQCYNEWRHLKESGGAAATLPRHIRWYYSPISMTPKNRAPGWTKELTYHETPDIDNSRFRFYGDPSAELADSPKDWKTETNVF